MISPTRIQKRVDEIIKVLKAHADQLGVPLMAKLSDQFGHDPYLILIGCLLSLRTKDTTTHPACVRLFTHASNPKAMCALSVQKIISYIYPVGFYRIKAELLKKVSADILERFGGKVPQTQEELMSLPGVGPKTANLVLAEGFGIPAICVDTHVHRVSNRLGIIETQTPEQTQEALQRILPQEYWIWWNRWIVRWGQTICVPISPFCSECPLLPVCDQKDVKKHR